MRSKKRILITGGPTRAYLDPVRFLSNVSTGALAYQICKRLRRAGYSVSAVIGPSPYPFEELKLTELHRIETTDEMYRVVLDRCKKFRPDAAIFSAAVLDFEPVKKSKQKVSSTKAKWTIALRPSPKIVDEVGKRFPEIRRVGFKLETKRRNSAFAVNYLRRKGLVGLCLNYLADVGSSSHRAYLFDSDEKLTVARSKDDIARWIIRSI